MGVAKDIFTFTLQNFAKVKKLSQSKRAIHFRKVSQLCESLNSKLSNLSKPYVIMI